MNKLVNFYGDQVGIKELALKDFLVDYELKDACQFYKIVKKNNEKIKLDKKLRGKNGLVIFYSPNCSKCKSMIDFWTEISVNYMYSFTIYAVNCDNLKKHNDYLLPLLNIEFYPSYFKFDLSGTIERLNLEVNLQNILFYISNNS